MDGYYGYQSYIHIFITTVFITISHTNKNYVILWQAAREAEAYRAGHLDLVKIVAWVISM